MENDFDDVILRGLQNERARLNEQLQTLDHGIAQRKAALLSKHGPVSETPASIKPDDFGGMKTSRALEKYLKQRGGGPIHIGRVAVDLKLGGADLGPDPEYHGKNI